MFKVTVEGAFAGYSDTAVYVKVAGNGCYVPCEAAEAGGVCVKLPYEREDEDGNTVKGVEDIVFRLGGGELLGTEQEAELEEMSGSLVIDDMKSALDTLGVENTDEETEVE
jgi:hypothetical protein